jgi:hypothetical protein
MRSSFCREGGERVTMHGEERGTSYLESHTDILELQGGVATQSKVEILEVEGLLLE